MNTIQKNNFPIYDRTQEKKRLDAFYKIFWIFFIGGIVGFFIETVWCYFDFGGFSSRTSNLFFPFSIVWAMGAVVLLALLHSNQSQSLTVKFIKGCIFCGIFEFLCGYAGQLLLGVTFWDYTDLPLNIGRYVNVFICVLWGFLCIIWEIHIYPRWDNKVKQFISKRRGRVLTIYMICFMIVTNGISGMALLRMEARGKGLVTNNRVESFLDTYFTDEVLQAYFPKMKYLNGNKVYTIADKQKKSD